MAQVTVMLKNGRLKKMDEKSAKALVHVKKAILFGDYEKKVMVAAKDDKEKKNTYQVKSVTGKTDVDDNKENNQTTKKSSGRPKKSKD